MLKIAVVGLGYFSEFHLAAWNAHPTARLAAVVDIDLTRTRQIANDLGAQSFRDTPSMLKGIDPDIIDLVVPPQAHASLIRNCLKEGRTIICQKPFCTSLAEATAITTEAESAGTTLVIHENFRFQPWYRSAKRFLKSGRIGQIYNAHFALRPGDGRGPDAYLARQPSFQKMPRFLIQETAVHQMDVFRYLLGPITSVYADLRRLNPAIEGEDSGVMILTHADGAISTFDGNRLVDHVAQDNRRTMGELQIEGEGGTLSLSGDGILTFRTFGSHTSNAISITDPVDLTQFGGGCVAALINHVVDATLNKTQPENTAREYLNIIRLVDAAYQSNEEGRRITL